MNIGQVKRLSRGDIPEAPAWFDKIFTLWAQSFEPLYNALARRLTFGDNMQGEEKEIEMGHDEEVVVQVNLKSKVTRATVVRTSLFDPASWAWEAITSTSVRVKVQWATAPTGKFLVLWRFESE